MPVLYSFRRCPYAIRARLALRAAGFQPGRNLELREVDLRGRPPELLEASPRGTVPVLVLADGTVLAESLEIMRWAWRQHLPGAAPAADGPCVARREPWLGEDPVAPDDQAAGAAAAAEALLRDADGPFKHHLDRCRYPERFGVADAAHHRAEALALLRGWNRLLQSGGWLLGCRPSLVDTALLPFVRQFRLGDPAGFDAEPQLEALQAWLQRFLASPELAAVMEPPWGLRQPWSSPRWLYHLALADDWSRARCTGVYPWSTRGQLQQQVGFVHLCRADQIAATWRRFYADAGPLRLLSLDPAALLAAGRQLRHEPAPGGTELFPHLYGGPLPLEAVRADGRFRAGEPAGSPQGAVA